MSEIISTNYREALDLANRRWIDFDKESGCNDKLANAVVETVRDIENRQDSIYKGNVRHARLYCGYTPLGLAWGTGPGINQRAPFEATKNVARGVCDTATSLIVKSRPKSTFVTDGADFDIMTQAEDMNQFMLGAHELSNIYNVAPRSFLDSTIFGTGGWKYIGCGTGEEYRVECERFLIDDIIVDEDECRTGLCPEVIYHRMIVSVNSLIRKYAKGNSKLDQELRLRLRAAAENGDMTWPNKSVPRGKCMLVEAIYIDPWGLNDSRRVLCTNGVVLSDDEWPFDFFPYTFLWWSLPISGFYGDGVCYRQYGRQQRITYMYRWIQRVQDLFGTPRAWVDPSGGPPALQLSNELGAIITARKPPTFQVQNSVPPEAYRWLDELETGCFEDEGMTNGAGQGQLPPGVDSAPAQREWNYRETQKFAPLSQRWESSIAVESSKKIIAMYKHHVEHSNKKPKVSWLTHGRMFSVKFPDLDKDAYIIRAQASSLDSLSPAARTQSALELAQTGWLTPQEGRELLSHPDLKESDDLANSGITYAKWVLRQLRLGKQIAVDNKTDLVSLDKIVRQGRQLDITREASQHIIDSMSEFLDQIDLANEAMKQAQAEMQQNLLPPPMSAGPANIPVGAVPPPV